MSSGQIKVLSNKYFILEEVIQFDESFMITGFDRISCQPVQIFKYPLNKFKNQIKEIKSETKYSKENISHKNLIRIINESIESQTNFYCVEEYCYIGNIHSLFIKFIKEYKIIFSQKIIKNIVTQLVNGLDYLFENNIKHSQLDINNIMLTYDDYELLFNTRSKMNDIFILRSK
jgi:serine/threonine protein kinase